MGTMHRRLTFRRPPFYKGAMHIVVNERTVTRLDGEYRGARLPMYVVQIAARTVHGIDSYFRPGERVRRGEIFGMIRIGSQVDLVVPWREGMRIAVRAGDRVRAGETVVIE
jgi:phosphatidylserine decarboxylase